MGLINLIESAEDIAALLYQQYKIQAQDIDQPIEQIPPTIKSGEMRLSAQGVIEIANYEALAYTKYIDSGGVQTIGIGMTSSEIKDLSKWKWDKALSLEECLDMYMAGLSHYVAAVNHILVPVIPQHQFDMLVSVTYNIGIGAMSHSTFMRRVNAGSSISSICEAIKRYCYDNGKVVQGLVNRRVKECQVFTTGHYSNNGTVQIINVDPNTHKPHYNGHKQTILNLAREYYDR